MNVKKKPAAQAAKPPVSDATATHRCVVSVVSAADRDAANVILIAANAGFQSWFVQHPVWDGITLPAPPPDAYGQRWQNQTAVVETYVEALEQCITAGLDVTYYEGVVLQAERNIPQNTLASIYGTGYNPALPVRDANAGVAIYLLETTGSLPPIESF